MIFLANTSSLIQVVSALAPSGATPTLACYVAYLDTQGQTVNPGDGGTAIATATTTTICASPASGFVRHVKYISVQNANAGPVLVTLQITDGTTLVNLYTKTAVSLLGGAIFSYHETKWHISPGW